MEKPLKIGLTGGIGAGKSTIARVFAAYNIPIYDSDSRAKELMATDPYVRKMLVKEFGDETFENDKLNTKHIADIVFQDIKKLHVLNGIVHPAMAEDFESWAHTFYDIPYIIKEAAILFESKANTNLDGVIYVFCDLNTRIDRVLKRDKGSTRESVIARMKSQWDEDRKQKLSDYIITNTENSFIIPQVAEIDKKLRSRIY